MGRPIKKVRGVYEYPPESGIWWICFFDQYRHRHREKVGMHSTAVEIYQKRKTQVREGKFEPEDVQRKHRNATVAEIIDDYIRASEANGRKTLEDIKQRAQFWKDRLGDRAARGIVGDDIETARLELAKSRLLGRKHKNASRKKPRAIATVNRYLATLKSAFLMAIANDKVTKNPFRKVKFQKENNTRVRFLTEDEEARLLAVLPPSWKKAVIFAIHTGMRFSEQMGLRWQDVDFKQKVVTVRESKAGKKRHIPLNQIAIDALNGIPQRIDCPWVFYTGNGEGKSQLPRQWEEWLGNANIKDFHWHDLRHTFASRLVMAGIDLYVVMELLGHHSIEMTQRYAHLGPKHLKQAVEALVFPVQVPSKLPLAVSST